MIIVCKKKPRYRDGIAHGLLLMGVALTGFYIFVESLPMSPEEQYAQCDYECRNQIAYDALVVNLSELPKPGRKPNVN